MTLLQTMSDSALVIQGMEILVDQFGEDTAERFVQLVSRKRFDYTEVHDLLFDGMTIDEICEEAKKLEAVTEYEVKN